MRGLGHDAGDRVVNAPACAGDFRTGCVDDFFLRVVHQHHARIHPLAHHRTGRNGTVDVEEFDPVVVLNAGHPGIVFTQPDHRSTAIEREHHQVVGVRAVNAPLLVRRDEVQGNFLVAIGLPVHDAGHGFQVHRWAVTGQAFTKGNHPGVVQVEVLATGEGAPWDHLVHIGVAGVVTHGLGLDAAPGGAGNNFARLRLDVTEANLFVFAVDRQVRMVAPGDLA